VITVTVFDGRTATQQPAGSRTIRITGSPQLVADRAGAQVVAPLRARLRGATDVMVVSPSGTAAGAVAYVIARDAVISLSGRAVTAESAAAIAHALRPV
jgi:hypothetical protein